MNRKAIKSVLKKVFLNWMNSITDIHVKNLVRSNTIITGGSITSMLMGEQIKDFDLYFRNKETAKAVANYYIDKFNTVHTNQKTILLDGPVTDVQRGGLSNSKTGFLPHRFNNTEGRLKIVIMSGHIEAPETEEEQAEQIPFEDFFDTLEQADELPGDLMETGKEDESKKEKYRPIYLSPNAITLSDRIQLVIRFYGEPREIHDTYDFVHCMNYWDSNSEDLTLNPEALEAILSKTLVYKGSKYPVCSVIRARKFINRGWKINAGQYLKIAFQISELDLKNIDVLEDQLVGVDSAYFMALIDALANKMQNDPRFTVTTEYVSTIIDRIFG